MSDVGIKVVLNEKEIDKQLNSIINNIETKADKAAKKLGGLATQFDAMFKNMAVSSSKSLDPLDKKIDEIKNKISSINTAPKNIKTQNVLDVNTLHESINSASEKQKKAAFDYTQWWSKAIDKKDKQEQIASEKRKKEADNYTRWWDSALDRKERKEIASAKRVAAEQNKASNYAASSKGRIAAGAESVDTAFGMPNRTIQERIEKIKALTIAQQKLNDTTKEGQNQSRRVNQEIHNLKKANKEALTSGIELEKGTNRLATSFENLSRRVAFYASLGMLTGVVRSLFEIRGEYQMLEKSLGAIIGDYEKGSKIFAEQQKLAVKSPFTVIDLVSANKQLAAYGFAVDELVPITKRLSDISAGLGVETSRIIYNVGQIKAKGVLDARDLRDFGNAGLNVLGELSKMYSQAEGRAVSTGEVFERVSARMVSYADVMAVINRYTDEGGMFFNMQVTQAETLKGKLSNLTDAWNNMLNEIGKSKDIGGAMNDSIDIVKSLITNYKTVIEVISGLALSYGALKASQLVSNALMGKEVVALNKMIIANKKVEASKLLQESRTRSLTQAERELIATTNRVTAADKLMVINNKLITESQAQRLLVMGRLNREQVLAAVKNDILSASFVRQAQSMTIAQRGLYLFGASLKVVALQAKAMTAALLTNPFTWITVAIAGIVKLTSLWSEYNKKLEDTRKHYADIAKEFDKVKVEFYIEVNKGDTDAQLAKLKEAVDNAKSKYGIDLGLDISKIKPDEIVSTFALLDNKILETQAVATNFGLSLTKALGGADEETALDKASERYDRYKNSVVNTRNVMIAALEENKDKLTEIQKEQLKLLTIERQSDRTKDGYETEYQYIERLIESYKKLGVVGGGVYRVINELGITNKDVLEEMNSATYKYIDSIHDVDNDLGGLTKRLKSVIDDTLPKDQLEFRLKAFIDTEASQRNWDDFEKNYIYKWAEETYNIKFKPVVEETVVENNWQKQVKDFAKGLSEDVNVVFLQDERLTDFAKRMADEGKKSKEEAEGLLRAKAKGLLIDEQTLLITQRNADIYPQIAKYLGYIEEDKSKGSTKNIELENLKEQLSVIKDMQKAYQDFLKVSGNVEQSTAAVTERFKDVWSNVKGIGSLPKNAFNDLLDVSGDKQAMAKWLKDNINYLKTNDAKKQLEEAIGTLTFDAKIDVEKKSIDDVNTKVQRALQSYDIAMEISGMGDLGEYFKNAMSGVGLDLDFDMDISSVYAELDRLKAEIESTVNLPTDTNYSEKENDKAKALKVISDAKINLAKKEEAELVKSYNTLWNKYASIAEKIKKEEEIIAEKKNKLLTETNDLRRKLLELEIKDGKETIKKLQEESLKGMDFYQRLFLDVSNRSISQLSKIANETKAVLDNAELSKDSSGKEQYTIKVPVEKDGVTTLKEVNLSTEAYISLLKQLGVIQDKIRDASPFKKIADDIKSGNLEGALVSIGAEMKKVSDIANTMSDIAETLGANENTVEVINDISASIDGLGEATKGVSKLMEGDIIGGISSVLKGAWQAISTWFDNGDKKRERTIKRQLEYIDELQKAYDQLARAVEKQIGGEEMAARKRSILNKKAQIEAYKLSIAQEKNKKKPDKDRIKEWENAISGLTNDIEDSIEGISQAMLGTDLKGAAESFADAWVSAWKEGGDAMQSLKDNFEDMLQTMIVKSLASKIVSQRLKPLFDMIEKFDYENATDKDYENLYKQAESLGSSFTEGVNSMLENLMKSLGIDFGSGGKDKKLSGLSKGIQSVTEQTAGEIESKMGSIEMKAFEQVAIMTDISSDLKIQIGLSSQQLLVLRDSYQMQQSIYKLWQGMATAGGRSLNVKLVS